MDCYYNEIDPYCVRWLGNLAAGHNIAAGVIDARSIADVQPDDVRHFQRCHFFAGIGGWDYALQLADWPSTQPVWTGSCPCQPFSCTGKGKGEEDSRHLWPQFRRLIAECRPAIILGEQVASADGRIWLSRVRADLEELGYGVGAADLCAAGIKAPHIRQRLWWFAVYVADADGARWNPRPTQSQEPDEAGRPLSASGSDVCGMADCGGDRLQGSESGASSEAGREQRSASDGRTNRVEYAKSLRCAEHEHTRAVGGAAGTQPEHGRQVFGEGLGGGSAIGGLADSERDGGRIDQPKQGSEGRVVDWRDCCWTDYRIVVCSDIDKRTGTNALRRVSAEPGAFPLAARLPRRVGPDSAREERMGLVAAKANRVGRLKGYGNAIVPDLAADFIRTVMEILDVQPAAR